MPISTLDAVSNVFPGKEKPASLPSVRGQVHLALANAEQRTVRHERRRHTRFPYPYPVYLTPLLNGSANTEETFTVLGRHLSECGLDFYHHEPVPYRRMIASLERGKDRWMAFVIELTWCRFGRHGWYNNGGRFVSVTQSPLDETGTRMR